MSPEIPPRILQMLHYHYRLVKETYPEMGSREEGARIIMKQAEDAARLIRGEQGGPIADLIGLAVASLDYLATFYTWNLPETYGELNYHLG